MFEELYAVTPKSWKEYWKNSFQETEKNISSPISKIVLPKTDEILLREDLLLRSKTSLTQKDNSLNSSLIQSHPTKNIEEVDEKKRTFRVEDLKKKNRDFIRRLMQPNKRDNRQKKENGLEKKKVF